ncbi:MAG: histone deacetylase [Anaerolineae bacterium]
MKAFYADHFVLPLPEGHRFPMAKYARLRQRVVEDGIIAPHDLLVPPAATDEELLRCHDRDYVERVKAGLLTHRELLRIGFPWSPQMVERSRRSSGATIAAARAALSEGCAANLAGGTHHAGRDHGEGYCVFNDAPIAIRALQAEGLIRRAIVIDCDVHQGNGTADICRDDPTIFTLSIHGERNFPFRKVAGDMDIGLPDGTSDAEYLDTLAYALERALFLAQPEFAVYVSGADPFEGDKLGRLSLSKEGLRRRDEMVFNALLERRIPVAVAMGGGYAANVDDIVDIHAQTIRAAALMAQRWQNIYA